MRAGRRLLTELEALSKLALDQLAGVVQGGPSPAAAAAAGVPELQEASSPTVKRLEQEYRAKVVELESKMARAQLQVLTATPWAQNGGYRLPGCTIEYRSCSDVSWCGVVRDQQAVVLLA